jgi:hypothetical protein
MVLVHSKLLENVSRSVWDWRRMCSAYQMETTAGAEIFCPQSTPRWTTVRVLQAAPVTRITANVSSQSGRKPAHTDNDTGGGKGKLWVMTTGHTLNDIDFFKPEAKSSSSSVPATTAAASASAASTVAVTATSTPTAAASKGPNTAGIAAGVVVGVLVLAAIIGGMFFFLRNKKRRDVEEEYRRQAAVNQFTAGGKQMHTSNSSMTDSRLDPDFLARRQSNGSIADNEDYSRRILKVCRDNNAD